VKTGRQSRTSQGTTAVRAREMRKPAAERICHDPYAEHFLGPFFQTLRRYPLAGRFYSWIRELACPGLRGGILARTRYIDERLAAALAEGVEQLVILGAGYDSRAYRSVGPEDRVAVFEVDHPATQQAKIARVREVLRGIPDHVTFVPVDFCRDDLGRCLCAAGYQRDKKTLFIWEGVVYYLTADAVDASLSFVTGNSGPGSSIIFDYFPRSVIDGSCRTREARGLVRLVKRWGEPLLFGIEDREIAGFLSARGFPEFEVVSAAACKEAWFHGCNRSIRVPEFFRFVHARHFC
jgi:methyltransferase (TIGR00027 family)